MLDLQSNYIDVGTSDFAIDHKPKILRTTGIGSCIVICLYDKTTTTGALAHVMLPHQHNDDHDPGRYLDSAIPIVIAQLKKQNILINNLVATIVGGANMFPDLWSGENSVGTSNINTIKQILKELNIPIVLEVVGGSSGRSLEFELEYGKVNIYDKNSTR